MAQHYRYTDKEKHDRVLVRFTREDLLWRGELALGELGTVTVPVTAEHDRMLGPTILDMMVRHRSEDDETAWWTLRPAREFVEGVAAQRIVNGHPFRAGLVSGGKRVEIEGEFLRVKKISSVSIGAYAYRLAVGTLGSIHDAHAIIGAKAAAAWAADLVRAQTLYHAIRAAKDELLIEDAGVAALRPAGSVSEYIETDILRDACLALGVDPELNIRRGPGRPRRTPTDNTEVGDFISVTILEDGTVQAKTLVRIQGIAAFTDLARVPLLKLVGLVEIFRDSDALVDAELLEAYLDAVAPEWRDEAHGRAERMTSDPYEILGCTREMPFADITRAYRRTMQAIHPDRGACPRWFTQMASQAYREIKAQQPRSDDDV